MSFENPMVELPAVDVRAEQDAQQGFSRLFAAVIEPVFEKTCRCVTGCRTTEEATAQEFHAVQTLKDGEVLVACMRFSPHQFQWPNVVGSALVAFLQETTVEH